MSTTDLSGELTELRSAADRLIDLHDAGDLDAVLELADEVTAVAADGDLSDEVVRESLFVARFQRAMVLTEREDLRAAEQAYADAASIPTDTDDPDQRHEVAMALLHQGMCLDALDEPERAVSIYGQIVERFGVADDPVTRDQVVRARVNRAASHLHVGDAGSSLQECQELIDHLDPTMPLDAEQWLMARRVAAAALQALDRPQDAVAMLEGAGIVDLDDDTVRGQQAQAHLDRAEVLADLDQPGAAADARQAADAIAVSLV
jgi:tetratricopeptide (TPR) repeat protein